jgi:magnesium transporter
MIHVVRWDPTSNRAEHVSPDALPAARADVQPDEVFWIDLDNPTTEEEERILQRFLPVHPLTFADVTKLRREPEQGPHLPKVEEFPDYLLVIVNPLPAELASGTAKRLNKKTLPQLSAVLNHQVLVTHHYEPMPCVSGGQGFVARHPGHLGRGPDFVFHLILDGIVDEYAPVVERFGEQLDRLERHIFRKPTQALLARLLRVKRQVSYLRKTLILEREVLARLVRGEFNLVDVREMAYYRNVYDHLVRYTELIESAREMVSDLMQSHLAAVSNKLNEVMKTLTMISVIGAICTLIAGIYGMNFTHMPEIEWTYGYPFALGLMATAVAAAFAVFKWKRWI